MEKPQTAIFKGSIVKFINQIRSDKSILDLWPLVLSISFLTAPAFSITPMEYYNSLVAGGDDPGYRDGEFYQARFDHPTGLAFDDKGERLFVADRLNHRIRVVYLNENNRVETLAGTGVAGKMDGPLNTAAFNRPSVLAFVPPEKLAVYDAGNHLIRLIDLKTRAVTTIAGDSEKSPAVTAWNMLYRAKDNCLYFSEPENGRLQKLDLKSWYVSTVLSKNPLVPMPKVLCLSHDKLFIADQDLSGIYLVDWATNSLNAQTPGMLHKAGVGNHVQEMTASEANVYVLQEGKVPLAQVLPAYRPVSLPTAWGFLADNENPIMEPLISFSKTDSVGFIASPTEPRKFFITNPGPKNNSIISVKDYSFDSLWKAQARLYTGRSLSDFEYPAKKPPKTFRILMTGDSRLVTAAAVKPEVKDDPHFDARAYSATSAMINTVSKQLEFSLNAQAALRGVETHFEVLTYGCPGRALISYINDEIPVLVKKYDVDFVILLPGWSGYQDYYEKHLNPDGFPTSEIDGEYLLKPLASRTSPGAPTRLYQWGIQKGVFKNGHPLPLWYDLLATNDLEVRANLIEMAGRPLRFFADRLQSTKTLEGKSPKLLFFYVPWRDQPGKDETYEMFWTDVYEKYHLPFLDLTGPFNALKISYYPTNELCCGNHYTAYGGAALIAQLLEYNLVEKKIIPFKLSKQP